MSEVNNHLVVRAKAYGFHWIIERPLNDNSFLFTWDVVSEHKTKEEAGEAWLKIIKNSCR